MPTLDPSKHHLCTAVVQQKRTRNPTKSLSMMFTFGLFCGSGLFLLSMEALGGGDDARGETRGDPLGDVSLWREKEMNDEQKRKKKKVKVKMKSSKVHKPQRTDKPLKCEGSSSCFV
jgi:hypothetical protein